MNRRKLLKIIGLSDVATQVPFLPKEPVYQVNYDTLKADVHKGVAIGLEELSKAGRTGRISGEILRLQIDGKSYPLTFS